MTRRNLATHHRVPDWIPPNEPNEPNRDLHLARIGRQAETSMRQALAAIYLLKLQAPKSAP